MSDGALAHAEPVDYVLEYQPQRSFLISVAYPSVLIGESKTLGDDRPLIPKGTATALEDKIVQYAVAGRWPYKTPPAGVSLRIFTARS